MDHAYIWTYEWQELERPSDADSTGNFYVVFRNPDAVTKWLIEEIR